MNEHDMTKVPYTSFSPYLALYNSYLSWKMSMALISMKFEEKRELLASI
jgi:hypothetical protein